MKMIAAWDYQMSTPPAAAYEWWVKNIPAWCRGEYAYRIEFWKTEDGKCAVVYEYSKHPVTGERYVCSRSDGLAQVAVNPPRVISVDKFPPKNLR